MLSALTLILNPYDRKARLQPALLTGLPLFVCLAVLVSGFGWFWSVVSGMLLFCGATTWLTQLGRDRGKALEPALFRAWGGKPSVAMLRHRDERLATSDKERYRAIIRRMVPELKLAPLRKEQRSPEQADDGYQGATTWLLEQTRDRRRFELIFRENMNYGFRRNLWALKPFALTFDIISIAFVALSGVGLLADIVVGSSRAITTIIMCALIAVVHASVFVVVVRSDWVRGPAEAYAEQLLAASDRLSQMRLMVGATSSGTDDHRFGAICE